MIRLVLLITAFCFGCSILIAQEAPVEASRALKGNLSSQFDYVYKKSKAIDYGKLISDHDYNHLKNSTLDSVKVYKKKLSNLNQMVDSLTASHSNLIIDNQKLSQENDLLTQKDTSVHFLGMSIDKGLLNLIILGFIVLILLLLIIFILKYKTANANAQVAINNLAKAEDEFIEYKRKSMEKEQILGRKLQDEINKNKYPEGQ